MKVDLNFKIQKIDGSEFIDILPDGVNERGQPKYVESEPLTLRKAITDSFILIPQDDKKVDPEEKAKRGWFAMRIHNHPEPAIDLTSDEVTLCKDLIGKRYNNSLIVALAWEVLDPASKK